VSWTLERSNLHFERARERLPLGVASDCGYWGEGSTVYARRAAGARLWDIDGNVYIDYRLGCGQVILGYAEPRVARAARAAIGVGGAFALATELEFAVAERIARLVPAAELVRFANSGAEAVADALRLARAFTGREEVAVVDGGPHGTPATPLWGIAASARARGPSPAARRVRGWDGVPIHAVSAIDANGFEALLRGHGDRIGAFLVQPIPAGRTSAGVDAAFLGDVRALCDRFEVVLIVDERAAGFRVARGGAQEALGVRADLCAFGASTANGFPIAALAGREAIMRAIGIGVADGGTYAAHPVSLAAAEKTLAIIEETDALAQIAKYGTRMREGMNQVLCRRDIPHVFAGPPSMGSLYFGELAPCGGPGRATNDDAFCADLVTRLRGAGILCDPDFCGPWFVSAAHDELCLAETLAKFEHAIDAALERLHPASARTSSALSQRPRSFARSG